MDVGGNGRARNPRPRRGDALNRNVHPLDAKDAKESEAGESALVTATETGVVGCDDVRGLDCRRRPRDAQAGVVPGSEGSVRPGQIVLTTDDRAAGAQGLVRASPYHRASRTRRLIAVSAADNGRQPTSAVRASARDHAVTLGGRVGLATSPLTAARLQPEPTLMHCWTLVSQTKPAAHMSEVWQLVRQRPETGSQR